MRAVYILHACMQYTQEVNFVMSPAHFGKRKLIFSWWIAFYLSISMIVAVTFWQLLSLDNSWMCLQRVDLQHLLLDLTGAAVFSLATNCTDCSGPHWLAVATSVSSCVQSWPWICSPLSHTPQDRERKSGQQLHSLADTLELIIKPGLCADSVGSVAYLPAKLFADKTLSSVVTPGTCLEEVCLSVASSKSFVTKFGIKRTGLVALILRRKVFFFFSRVS